MNTDCNVFVSRRNFLNAGADLVALTTLLPAWPTQASTLQRGQSHVLALHNETAWHHPIHLHGHSFRTISRNDKPTRYREWQDTVLMSPRERIEIAFVADNPGDWMFHCHIAEHLAGGMMGIVRVA